MHKINLQINAVGRYLDVETLDSVLLADCAEEFWEAIGSPKDSHVLIWSEDPVWSLLAIWSPTGKSVQQLHPQPEKTPQEPERVFLISYQCPECEHEWEEEYECACNSECPKCGTTDIEASDYEQINPPPVFYLCKKCGRHHPVHVTTCPGRKEGFSKQALDNHYGEVWVLQKPQFYECGCCSHHHPANWDGDCRDDEHRYSLNRLEDEFGNDGWEEVPQPDAVSDSVQRFLPGGAETPA